jgi:hypothetical protein
MTRNKVLHSTKKRTSSLKGILIDPVTSKSKDKKKVIFFDIGEYKEHDEEQTFMKNRKKYKRDRELVNAGGTLHRFKKTLNQI